MTVALQLNLYFKNSEFQTKGELYVAFAMGITLVLVPIVYSVFLTYYSKEITSRAMKNKWEAMYTDIHNYRSKWSKYYIVVTMIRRMLFALIPAYFHKYDYVKV